MLHKLVTIKNVGKFKNLNSPFCDWDGVFSRVNLFFGQNRSGKTTLSLILKSLSGDDKIIIKKLRFNSESEPIVKIIDHEKKILEYKNSSWNKHYKNIKIFDIHYIEENLYTGYLSTHSHKENLFEIIVGAEGIELKSMIEKIQAKRRALTKERNRIKRIILKLKQDGKIEAAHELENDRKSINTELSSLQQKVTELNIKLGGFSKEIFLKNADLINKYLKVFAPDIQVKKFSKTNPKHLVSFILSVNGTNVHLSRRNEGYEAKYVLSEGDRNALAFSFFLSQLENENNLNDSIIVFDDPISSFDYSRKTFTINYLHRFATKVSQLFILTHDIVFARDCYKKFQSSDITQLKLIPKGSESEIIGVDLEKETLSGVFKDLIVVSSYLESGANSDNEKRDVKRCIRPILEGFLRIKYFNEIKKNEWLGDIIKNIRNSNHSDRLNNLAPHLNDIEDLNDYSKDSHHSNPAYLESEINDAELRAMIIRLQDVLIRI